MFLYKHELKKETFKCYTCKFNYDKNQVNTIEIHEQKFLLCQQCDKILEHKKIMLTKVFEMKGFLSVRFRDTSLTEIAKMVNYYKTVTSGFLKFQFQIIPVPDGSGSSE